MGIRVQRTGARAAAGRWQKNEGIQTCAKGAAAVLSRQAKVAMTCVVRSVRARHVNASRAQCAPKARFSAAGRPALVAAARSLPMLLRNHEPARPPSALRIQAMQSRRLREEVGISCSQPVGWKHAARTPLISRCAPSPCGHSALSALVPPAVHRQKPPHASYGHAVGSS
jgi:hypothetical protein